MIKQVTHDKIYVKGFDIFLVLLLEHLLSSLKQRDVLL